MHVESTRTLLLDPATEAVIARVAPEHRTDVGVREQALGIPPVDEAAAPFDCPVVGGDTAT